MAWQQEAATKRPSIGPADRLEKMAAKMAERAERGSRVWMFRGHGEVTERCRARADKWTEACGRPHMC